MSLAGYGNTLLPSMLGVCQVQKGPAVAHVQMTHYRTLLGNQTRFISGNSPPPPEQNPKINPAKDGKIAPEWLLGTCKAVTY